MDGEKGTSKTEILEELKKLAPAAQALLADYAAAKELKAFSVLDGEDFHA